MAKEEKFYYIVNPKGAIHDVSESHARARLKMPGWRLATKDEIADYQEAGGNQRFDRPIAEPFQPLPAEDSDELADAQVKAAVPAATKTAPADKKGGKADKKGKGGDATSEPGETPPAENTQA